MDSPRLAAAKTLIKVVRDNAYSNIELSNSQAINGENKADRSLYAAIVRTALERRNTIDYIVSMFARREPDIIVKCLLYTGISQLLYMDRIPDSACCDETVKAAKLLADSKRAGFVNGVLRNVCRERAKIEKAVFSADDSVKYSMDKSICSLIRNQYGQMAEEIFQASFKRQDLCVRVNTLKNDMASLAGVFEENGVICGVREGLLYVIEGRDKAVALAETGLFYIQGAPSQYAVSLLNAKPGMTVVDACACPGGKILGAALDMQNRGRAAAFDIHANKLPLIIKTAEKLGVTVIETAVRDSRIPAPELKDAADAVICDVPCSSLGVIASKPEIRYKDISDLKALYKTQEEILDASSSYVKRGGTLVYSTCTINKAENEAQVKLFLEKHKDFILDKEKAFITDTESGCFEGFYAACFVRGVSYEDA